MSQALPHNEMKFEDNVTLDELPIAQDNAKNG